MTKEIYLWQNKKKDSFLRLRKYLDNCLIHQTIPIWLGKSIILNDTICLIVIRYSNT